MSKCIKDLSEKDSIEICSECRKNCLKIIFRRTYYQQIDFTHTVKPVWNIIKLKIAID